jgi:hypothetical protein
VTDAKQRRVTVQHTVAFWLRYHRENWGLPITQEEVAAAAQRLGFQWSRSSVAAIEQETRELTAAELLALPYILAEAAAQQPGMTAAGVSLFDIVRPGRSESLALSEHLLLSLKQAELYIDQGADAYRVRHPVGNVVTEAEQKAAARLDVSVESLQGSAFTLWGRSLPDERDQRVGDRKEVDASARTVQALRGHVTRELLAELAEFLGVEP